jgi:hypothetical protein
MISRNHLGYIAPQQHSLGQACGNGAQVKSFSAHGSRWPRNRASLLSPVRGGSLAQIRPIVGQASRLRPVRGCPPRCASRSLCGFRSAASTGCSRTWHPMASPGTSWHCVTEPRFPDSQRESVCCAISRTAFEAGGRAFESRPGHHLFSRRYAARSCERCASNHRTTPNHSPLAFLRHCSGSKAA